MGKGGEASIAPSRRIKLLQRIKSMDGLQSAASMQNFKRDLATLKHMWFKKTTGDTHAARLEAFYATQAAHCERHRPTHAGINHLISSLRNVTSLMTSERAESHLLHACAPGSIPGQVTYLLIINVAHWRCCAVAGFQIIA